MAALLFLKILQPTGFFIPSDLSRNLSREVEEPPGVFFFNLLAHTPLFPFLPSVPPKKQLPGPEDLQKRFKEPGFRFLYFVGEEEFRKRRAAAHWETLLRKDNPALKIKKLFGSELDWGTFANHLSG